MVERPGAALRRPLLSWNLTRYAEQRLAREINLLRPARGGDVRVAIGYPNTYHVGMSNLGLQVVYGLMNQTPGVSCERFFLPDPPELAAYRAGGRQLMTLETQQPVGSFDLVAFSCAYENDYVHLLQMLELAGIPLLAKDRSERDPLVCVGGAVTLLNPEPIADFVDFFCVGEAEGLVDDIVDGLRETVKLDRPQRLKALALIPGLYVPSLYQATYGDGRLKELHPIGNAPVQIAKNYISREDFIEKRTASWIMTPDTEFANSYLIEVSRGCPYICRFCTVGFSYPKVRWTPLERIWESIESVAEHRPRVGLISATIGNHPDIDGLCRKLMEAKISVSFSSLRADRLPDSIVEAMVAGGTQSMTLAPETGSEDLRRSINKRFTDEEYFTASRRALKLGIKNIKMYSMVGLPNEEDKDMDSLVSLVQKTRKIQVEEGRSGGRITLSLGLFVPKPLTPYQWNAMARLDLADERMRRVLKGLTGLAGVKVNHETPKTALIEGLLSRADRRMGRVLLRVYQKPSFKAWEKALEAEGMSFEQELYRQREPDEVLPWAHIASSWPKERLLRDSLRARDQRYGIIPANLVGSVTT
jgi:radical SAM superfamily enzyme YgiQ (UPF0313 family)